VSDDDEEDDDDDDDDDDVARVNSSSSLTANDTWRTSTVQTQHNTRIRSAHFSSLQ